MGLGPLLIGEASNFGGLQHAFSQEVCNTNNVVDTERLGHGAILVESNDSVLGKLGGDDESSGMGLPTGNV